MANVKITDLPAAQPLDGTELVPIVQSGITVRTTTAAVAGSPSQQQTFITVNQEPTLPNSRALQAQTGIGITDGGAQGPLTIALNGAGASLEAAGDGFVVKTGQTTITPRSLTVGSSGLSVSDGDGQAGNPSFSLTGQVLALANASGDGIIGLRVNGTLSLNEITGTTGQIDVSNGTGAAGNPTIALADNPIVPGDESLTLPIGSTSERPASPVFGMIRANEETGNYEVYSGSEWTQLSTATDILSIYNNGTLVGVQDGINFIPGTGMTYTLTDNPGLDRVDVTQGIANTGVTAASYGSASAVATFTVNARGQLTTATTTSIAISASQITSGVLPITNGGTGANNATTARSNLSAAVSGANNDITSMSAITGSIGSPTYIQMDNGNAVVLATGRLWYTPNTGAWNLGMGGGNITQQVGEEMYVYGKASAAISGNSILQAIYKTGTVGASGTITFAPTIAGLTDISAIIGVGTEDIAHNSFGRVTSFGIVHGINTSGSTYGETWADNDDIWYNPVTGGLTKVKPSAPNMKIQIGTVINAGPGGSGSFQVLLHAGSILGGTDSNVQITGTPSDNSLLQYYSAGPYWRNVAASSVTVGTATNAVNVGVTDDTATATAVYPAWVSANTGNLPAKVTSTKLSFVPSTGVLTVTGGITGGTF